MVKFADVKKAHHPTHKNWLMSDRGASPLGGNGPRPGTNPAGYWQATSGREVIGGGKGREMYAGAYAYGVSLTYGVVCMKVVQCMY